MPKLRNGNNGDSNPGSLDCESGILPTELREVSSSFDSDDCATRAEKVSYLVLPHIVGVSPCNYDKYRRSSTLTEEEQTEKWTIQLQANITDMMHRTTDREDD